MTTTSPPQSLITSRSEADPVQEPALADTAATWTGDEGVPRLQQADPEFAAFGRAILVGTAIGIPVMGAAMALAVWLLAPEMELASLLAIAAWVGLFSGPFLAGTVTVGLSSRHSH